MRSPGVREHVDVASLKRKLAAGVDGEVRFDAGTRGAYSTDASNFRQVPIGVVIPRTVEAAVVAVSVSREHRAPLLSRGGGTSLAGQCTNAAVVIDWTKYCRRVVSVEIERRRCTVEPGIVLDELNRQLAPTGLRYGPEPATHANCTLGGMIGNNSCGATAQRTGKVVDNTPRLEVLLYDDDAVSAITPHDLIALEGLDRRLVRAPELKHEHADAIEQLPDGNSWLLVQFGGDTVQEAIDQARRMLADLDVAQERSIFHDDPARQAELWQAREAGLGASAHVPGRRDTWEGWEDSAVPPERLGRYLRDLDALYEQYGYVDDSAPALFGHFGHGCVHTRIPFDLYTDEGVADYRRFMQEAADLVCGYGGSLSGEHGDGETRGELLPRMFGHPLVEAFRTVKEIFDPENRMNPGKVVEPDPLDANLRLGGDWHPPDLGPRHFSFPDDGGSFAQAANRCVGVGKCRRHSTEGGAVMCPSYHVTLEEEHSTRGRARLLFELLNGHGDGPIEDRWRSDAVHDALDLCLACKGCRSDCPVNVDMATYKAEFFSHYWKGGLRPRSTYALGWLPALGAAVTRLPLAPLLNTITQRPRLRRVACAAAGLEQRSLPRFAGQTLQAWAAAREPPAGPRGELLLWPDTFTNPMHPQVGQAAVRVLEHAGWTVRIPTQPLFCGLTRISTGQLPTAKRVLGRTIRAARDHVRTGGLIVGLEPSCTAVLRGDAPQLLPHDPDVRGIAEQTVALSELLRSHTPGWRPPKVTSTSRKAIVQVHCHQHAVLGWEADQALLRDCGVEAERLDSGCRGLAGTQINQLDCRVRHATHLAELLAAALQSSSV